MSSTTLVKLAAHIDEHELPWARITDARYNLRVQLGSDPDALIRWVATLGAVVWSAQDLRQLSGDSEGFWAVEITADLDGDVKVWCDVPADFADTSEAVVARMTELADAHRESVDTDLHNER